jgi:hypothetical protein
MPNEQLKKDIALWQEAADATMQDDSSDPVEDRALIDEARTLLLRASQSLL